MADRLRPLATGEIALLRSVFGDRIDYGAVRLSDGYGVNPIPAIALRQPGTDAITLRNTIYFGGHYSSDFASASAESRALLAHEMTHVWQWRDLGMSGFLSRYAREFLACGGQSKAMYRYAQKEAFAAARLEAQAQMVQDYYLRRERRQSLSDLEASLAGTKLYDL